MIDVFYLDKTVKKAEFSDISKLKNKKVWIDITDIKREEADRLKEIYDLHPLTAEDLYNATIRIKVEEFPNYLFSIFYSIGRRNDLIELDFILGNNFIISNHKKMISSFDELKKDMKRLKLILDKGTDMMFHKLIDMEVDNYFPILEQMDDKIEQLEEKITKRPSPAILKEILSQKREIVKIKKIAFQQREKTGFLAKNQYKLISHKAVPYFRDIYDHAIRVSDTIDNYREAIGNAFDVYMSAISNNMNEVMKVLSIIATIALPLTVISGIYGTNFNILPGADFQYGFWTMMVLMIIMSSGMVFFFRKRGWF